MTAPIDELRMEWLIEHCSRYNGHRCKRLTPNLPTECCNGEGWPSWLRRVRYAEKKGESE